MSQKKEIISEEWGGKCHGREHFINMREEKLIFKDMMWNFDCLINAWIFLAPPMEDDFIYENVAAVFEDERVNLNI